jgi:Tfp pilus assembly protein PilE
MVFHQDKSVTLIELIVAISLVAVMILGINNISIFSHNHAISSDRRAKVQNNVSLCLEHITKQGVKTIGNERIFGSNTAVLTDTVLPETSLAFFIDANGDGRKDTSNDHWIKYTFSGSPNYELSYGDNCGSSSAPGTCSSTEVLAKKITVFTPTKVTNFTEGNHVEVEITGLWNPLASASQFNPEITMRTTIQLPSVSTN